MKNYDFKKLCGVTWPKTDEEKNLHNIIARRRKKGPGKKRQWERVPGKEPAA